VRSPVGRQNKKASLQPQCAALVSARQRESAEDVSLDTPLAEACTADLKKVRTPVCGGVALC
jgi:hypothetical protein